MWNNKVKAKLREEVALADKENGFQPTLIVSLIVKYEYSFSAAIKRYFESRKWLHRESQPDQPRVCLQEKHRKARSRRQRVSNVFATRIYSILKSV